MKNLKNSPHPYAMLTILFWSLAFIFTKVNMQYFSAFSLGFMRYLTASLALIVIAVRFKLKPPARRDLLLFLAAGFTGFFFYMIAFNQGTATVTSATGSVIIATVPVLTALFARVVYREKLRLFQWVAIGIEFAGVLILTLLDGAFSVNRGILWLLLAALSLSTYNLLQRKLTKTYSSLQTSTYSIFLGTVMLALFAPEAVRDAAKAPAVQFVYLIVLGVGASAIAYVSWSKAFSLAERTSQVSNYMFVTPFLTSLLAFVIAGEIPDRATLIGGGVILAGMLLYMFGDRRKA